MRQSGNKYYELEYNELSLSDEKVYFFIKFTAMFGELGFILSFIAHAAIPLYQQRSPLVSKKPPGGATDEQ